MKRIILLLVALSGFSLSSFGQNPNTWKNWDWLIGRWAGEASGEPGNGQGSFTFEKSLDGKILVRKGRTEFPANEKRQAFIHDDLMIIFQDDSGNPEKGIYFDNENHVLNYLIRYADGSIILTSVKVPGQPIMRLTYDKIDDGVAFIKFESSMDGEKFVAHVQGKSKRIK